MRKDPEANEIYRHFKGNLYQVKCIAADSESGQKEVVYQALYEPYGIYVRPLDMFMSETDHAKYPKAAEQFRFTLVGHAGDMDHDAGTDDKDNEAKPDDKKPESKTEDIKYEVKSCGRKLETDTYDKKPEIKTHNTNEQEKHASSNVLVENEEDELDPAITEFLDADTCEKKLAVLDAIHERITNDMINTMAVASDIEINDGDIETRFEDLRNCLMTMKKYECNRRQ